MKALALNVAMDDILDAMSRGEDDPFSFYLDQETGAVACVAHDMPGEEADEALADAVVENSSRYVEIPRYEGRDEYDLMCTFAESVDDDDVRDRLHVALQGKGAFGRFRDVLFRFEDVKAAWFTFRQKALVDAAVRWLRSERVEPIFTLRPVRKVEAQTERTSGGPRPRAIELFDLLLLGAPDGKTELVDGRVLRQISSTTPEEARGLFKTFARDLCGYYGVAWRNRFMEGKSELDLERAHLRVDGRLVQLRVDVAASAWKLFES